MESKAARGNKKMGPTTRFSLINGLLIAHCLLGALVLLCWTGGNSLALAQEQITVESRDMKQAPNSENELSDTLKYLEKLEKLDQYWSEVARPRFGRSEYKQPLLGFRMQPREHQLRGPKSQVHAMNLYEPRQAQSLTDLINARLAQRYNSNEAY